jgi:tetratricopeptide (TPR) repeat protein
MHLCTRCFFYTTYRAAFLLPLVLILLQTSFTGCKRRTAADITTLINELEQQSTQPLSASRADSLITLYRMAVQAAPEDHATNVQYLTRAAALQVQFNRDVVKGSEWLMEALTGHAAPGLSLKEPATLLARLVAMDAHNRGETGHLDSGDLAEIRRQLDTNRLSLDTSLIELNRAMGGASVKDTAAARVFFEVAEGYALSIIEKDSARAADLLEKAAAAAKTAGHTEHALDIYQRLSDRLPTQRKASTALFMIGFTYETDLNDTARARQAYETFLARYPQDELADDVQSLLKNLGRSPEELLREFEKMNRGKTGKKKKRG